MDSECWACDIAESPEVQHTIEWYERVLVGAESMGFIYWLNCCCCSATQKNGCQRSVHKTYTHTVADNHCTLDAKSNSSKSSSIGTQFIVIERERAVRFIKPPPIQWSQPTIRRMALKACGRNWTDESQPATEQHAACTACLHTFVFCNNGLWTVASCSPRVHSTLIRDAAQWPARERVVYSPLAHTYIQMGRTERNFCRW